MKLRFFARAVCFFSILTIQISLHSTAFAQQMFTFSDRDSVQVGDIIELTFVIQGAYTDLDLPDETAFPEEVEMVSRQRYQIEAGQDSLVYRLQFFGTDDVVLPAVAFRLQRAQGDTTLRSNRIPLYFKTVLSEEDEAFRPFKPVFTFARTWWPYILLLVLLIAGGYYLYRWMENRETEPAPSAKPDPIPFTNPLDELRLSISNLASPDALSEYEEYEAFYIELGDAIRRYIKRTYRFPALEMTTREICLELEKEQAASSTVKITRTVLNEADIVKFAHFKPDTDSAEHVLVLAGKFYDLARSNDQNRIDMLRTEYENRTDDNDTDHDIVDSVQQDEGETEDKTEDKQV
ncbi:hypothetical protein [Rhodohalobacter mucosus]|nr:hypothetical protein [Rhodohalobacter mucosus]